jgi:hypothetical protein
MVLNLFKYFSKNTKTVTSDTSTDAFAITIAILIVGVMIWYIFKYDGTSRSLSEINDMLQEDIEYTYEDIIGDEMPKDLIPDFFNG